MKTDTKKLCYSCQEAKNYSEFGEKVDTRDGLNNFCRQCCNKIWHERHPTLEESGLTNNDSFVIPHQNHSNYAFQLARKIAQKDMTLEEVEFELTDTKLVWGDVLNLLMSWKINLSSNTYKYVQN